MLEVCPPRNEMAAAPVNPRASRLFTTWFDEAAGARGYRVRTAHRPADRRPRGGVWDWQRTYWSVEPAQDVVVIKASTSVRRKTAQVYL